MNLYRLTTNGMLYSYRANLQNSYNTLANASNKVQTGRNFNSYAEDPAAASRAFQLRREHWQASAQLRNNDGVLTNFRQAFSTFDTVKNDLARDKVDTNTLRGLNDPDGTARKTLGQSSIEAAKAAVQTMNVKYSGKFLFAGADGMNVPFTWEMKPKLNADGTVVQEQKTDDAGNPVFENDGTTPVMQDVMEEQLCFRGIPVDVPEGSAEYKRLQEMMNEATYVDIGLGMQENDDGTPIKSTVYNSALSGLEFTDFGTDKDGDPKNVISLMNRIGKLLMTASDVNGTFEEGQPDYDELNRLCGKLEQAMDKMDVEFDELDTKASFLDGNSTRLTADIKALNEQILDVEEVDPVAAITSLSWAQYCYNAGLKIGTSILSQSLIDYMR